MGCDCESLILIRCWALILQLNSYLTARTLFRELVIRNNFLGTKYWRLDLHDVANIIFFSDCVYAAIVRRIIRFVCCYVDIWMHLRSWNIF